MSPDTTAYPHLHRSSPPAAASWTDPCTTSVGAPPLVWRFTGKGRRIVREHNLTVVLAGDACDATLAGRVTR
ncbi:hypothetical protein [Arthrobacter zhaoguopingii]|uniref:hypothetical protein n=1 Tax=Arthrobacter zhaoguopingii TaxID=2681491 RepID=UPI001358726B|nr:hypothetical protein [Arthrobacter zhaoguopingii]